MKKSEYIDRKIMELEYMENEVMKNRITSTYKYILALIPLVGITFVLGKYLLLYKAAVSLAVIDATLVSIARMKYKSCETILNQLGDEKKHLKKIEANGIKTSKELDRKRLERIKNLEQEQDLLNEQGKTTGTLGALAALTTIGGSLGIMINPLVGGIVSAVSLISANSLFNKDLLDEKTYNKLETRICNLRNDIELGSVYGYNTTSKHQNLSRKKEQTHSPDKTKVISEALEKQVDSYIESLTKQNNDTRGKTKVK